MRRKPPASPKASKFTQEAKSVLGPPSHTDPLIVDKMVTGVKLGMPEHAAAAYAGVDPHTFRKWRMKAVMFFAGDRRRAAYGELFQKLEIARMEAMANQLARFHKKANDSDDWRAHDTALKRLFPREFGDRVAVSHELGEQRAQDLFEIIVEECGPRNKRSPPAGGSAGRPSWPSPAPGCISMARPRRGPAARWATSTGCARRISSRGVPERSVLTRNRRFW